MIEIIIDVDCNDPNNLEHRVANHDAIRQAIDNLIHTNIGEIPFKPNFGMGLEDHLFQFAEEDAIDMILDRVISQVELFIPGVKVDPVKSKISFGENDKERVNLNLVIKVRGEDSFSMSSVI